MGGVPAPSDFSFAQAFPKPLQVHRAERAIVQAIARTSGFAPDHPAMVREIGAQGRIHFAHCRNVRVTGEHAFDETAHPTRCGDVDMFEVLRALHEVGFDGPVRPDPGRMIWGERGRAGYGLYDRALGAMYLHGLWEGITRMKGAA